MAQLTAQEACKYLPWDVPRKYLDMVTFHYALPKLVEPDISTGQIGTLIGVSIVSDAFTKTIREKDYVYAVIKQRKRNGRRSVAVYMWPKEGPRFIAWYVFKNARQANDHIKRIAQKR